MTDIPKFMELFFAKMDDHFKAQEARLKDITNTSGGGRGGNIGGGNGNNGSGNGSYCKHKNMEKY